MKYSKVADKDQPFFGHVIIIFKGLETIDDDLEEANLTLVKIDDVGIENKYGISELPSFVYIQSGIPIPFVGDLFNATEVKDWAVQEANSTRIHSVSQWPVWAVMYATVSLSR